MEKKALKSWDAICRHAQARAAQSLKRNDPIAWAYWKETVHFAVQCAASYPSPSQWKMGAFDCVEKAKEELGVGGYMRAALWYSRAKWFVILARANGIVMDPKKTGVNLDWIEAGSRMGGDDALARPLAAAH